MIEFDREVVQCILQGPFDVPLIAAEDGARLQSVHTLAEAMEQRDGAREAKLAGKEEESFAFTLVGHEADFYSSFGFPKPAPRTTHRKKDHHDEPRHLCTVRSRFLPI